MPAKFFTCPDAGQIEIRNCLLEGGCRMGDRCATRSYLRLVSTQRTWTGTPSTTQLIAGTMEAFLKLTQNYSIAPDQRAFMLHGTNAHVKLESSDDEYSLLEEKFVDGEDVTGIADVYESEQGKSILVDYKTSGSYKVAKALGFTVKNEPTGEIFKTGKRKGEAKTRKVLVRDAASEDRWEWELQLNNYAIKFEKKGFRVDELRIQCVVRDGNTYIARSRGVFRNIYYFKIKRLPDDFVLHFFKEKKDALFQALKQGYWNNICTAKENWDGLKCQSYCEVAEFCKYGRFLHKEKESEDMAIKGLSEIRRLPRLGKIRLGIKKLSEKSGKEYPAEVDYFILDPQTPSELENQKILDEFHKLYGDKPKSIGIMFPVAEPEVFFPQFYKRYGSGTLLKCKGNGETAACIRPEFSAGLTVIGVDELGLTKVVCAGKECPYYKSKECFEVAVLQVLLPELPGAGVWQLTTGSFHSIVNLNSCVDYIKIVCGRAHMIPLTLERREQEIAYEGKKTKHYILHINMDFKLADLQRFAMIDPAKILLELPAPEMGKEDIVFLENRVIENDVEKAATASVQEAEKKTNSERPVPKAKEPVSIGDDPKTKTDMFHPGDLARFKEQKEAAKKLLTVIAGLAQELGDAKFSYVLGNIGIEGLWQVTEVKILSEIVNDLLFEKRSS